MNEIIKLYENANIKPIDIAEYGSTYIPKKIEINGKPYPPFTAEKQLELIKFLIKDYNYYLDVIDANNFENSLAASLNDLWQDLTEEEKEQITEILNG